MIKLKRQRVASLKECGRNGKEMKQVVERQDSQGSQGEHKAENLYRVRVCLIVAVGLPILELPVFHASHSDQFRSRGKQSTVLWIFSSPLFFRSPTTQTLSIVRAFLKQNGPWKHFRLHNIEERRLDEGKSSVICTFPLGAHLLDEPAHAYSLSIHISLDLYQAASSPRPQP